MFADVSDQTADRVADLLRAHISGFFQRNLPEVP